MKIPININLCAPLGRSAMRAASLIGCAFITVGAMSVRADLADGLVGYWNFDGSLDDASESDPPANGVGKIWEGNHQDAPENLADLELADANYVDGKFGQCVKFADSFYVETPLELEDRFDFGAIDDLDEDDAEEEDPDLKGFTVSAWVTVDQFSKSWQCLAGKGEQNQWRLHRRGEGRTITGNGGNGDTPDGVLELPEDEDGTDVWYHVLLRSDRENDRHDFWVNGTMDAEEDGITPTGNVMPMMIGQNPDTADRTWEGNIDDVAMWNRPLTDDEIGEIWNNGDGTSVETALDPSDPNIAGSRSASIGPLLISENDTEFEFSVRNTGDTQALEVSGFTLGGDDADHFTIVESPTSLGPESGAVVKMTFNALESLGEYNATVTYTTNDPDDDDKTVVVALRAFVPNPDGPLAHFKLDETGGIEVADSTGNGTEANFDDNAGSVTLGGAGLVDGLGTSASFAGGGELETSRGFSLEGYSVSLWFQANALGDAGAGDLLTIVGQGEATPDMALLLASGDLHWFGDPDAPDVLFSTSGAPIEVGTVYHVAMIYDSATSTGRIILDGVEVASGDVPPAPSDGIFYAGAFGTSGALGFNGTIDDIQFYGKALDLETDIPFLRENPGEVLNPFGLGTDPDSDQDGLSDKDEVGIHMTDPTKADTDGDGLSDFEEVITLTTDPLNGDTDGDGFTDSKEVAGGTDPKDPSVPNPADFLVVHYDFNEGTGTAIGNLGSGDDGVLTNAHDAAWVADGSPDGSGYLNFNQDGDTSADSQHVATGLDASAIPVSGDVDYTMMAWVRADNTTGDNMIFGQLEAGNVLHNGMRNANYHLGHWGNDLTTGSVVVGEWHHVAWRYGAGVVSIVVDGVEAGSEARGGLAVESEVVIGATRGDEDRDFSGDLDDVRIYTAALSDTFIKGVADGGDPGEPIDPVDPPGLIVGSLIVNGSFEEPVLDNINTNNLGTAPTGWSQTGEDATWNLIRNDGTVYGSGVDNAADGSQIIDLNGEFEIFQNFTLAEDSNVVFGGSFSNREGHDGSDPSTVGIYDATGTDLLSPEVSVDTSAEPTPSEVWLSGEASVRLAAGEYQLRVDLNNFNNVDAIFASLAPGGESLADGLIAYYPLDGDFADTAGDAHGAEQGTAPIEFTDGVFGQGVDLDGVDQFIITPVETEDRFDFADGTGFSVSAWFRVDAFDKNWQAIVTKGEGTNWRIHRQADTDNLAPVAGGVNPDNGNGFDLNANPISVNDGEIHHVVITNIPDVSSSYYLDGVLIQEGFPGVPEGNEWPMMIGENANNGGNGRTFNGLIDDVAVWNRGLSADEVSQIFNGPAIGDQLEGGGGVDPVVRPGDIGQVLKADGAGPLSFGFPEGATFNVEYSTDLVNWTEIAAGVTGTYSDADAARGGSPAGYYRGVAQ